MFTEIDLQKWPRGQMFYYFANMAPTGYSLTVELDVTDFYDTVKKQGFKFFPSYLWIVTKVLNEQIEFKCGIQNEKLGYYDYLTPLYANFHEDDKTISLMWTEYCDDYKTFHARYIENQKKFGNIHGVLSQSEMVPPPNAYTVSALPWVNFNSFSVHSYENKKYFFPSIEAGKIVEVNGRKKMPLSITCHHATTDGYHISKFLETLQSGMNSFENFMN